MRLRAYLRLERDSGRRDAEERSAGRGAGGAGAVNASSPLAPEPIEPIEPAETALRRLLEVLPLRQPGPGFAARVARTTWLERAAARSLFERFRYAARAATVISLVVVGCGVAVAGTALGSLVTSLGFAGSAVWASRTLVAAAASASVWLQFVFDTAHTARQTLMASGGSAVVAVVVLCGAASACGLLALAQLRRLPPYGHGRGLSS